MSNHPEGKSPPPHVYMSNHPEGKSCSQHGSSACSQRPSCEAVALERDRQEYLSDGGAAGSEPLPSSTRGEVRASGGDDDAGSSSDDEGSSLTFETNHQLRTLEEQGQPRMPNGAQTAPGIDWVGWLQVEARVERAWYHRLKL